MAYILNIQAKEKNLEYSLEYLSSNFENDDVHSRFHEFSIMNSHLEQLFPVAKREDDEDLWVKVHTFALHFLSHGSSLPILAEMDVLDRSPLDYLEESFNRAAYYRGEGSPILKLFFEVFKDLFSQVDIYNKFAIGVIKPNRFSRLMERCCFNGNMTYIKVQDLSEISVDQTSTFFDLSLWMEKKLTSDWFIDEDIRDVFYAELLEVAENLQEETSFIGGVAELSPFVGVYLFFTKDQLADSKSALHELIADMLDFRGIVGSYPEMITLKKVLCEAGVRVVPQLEKQPTRDRKSIEENVDFSIQMLSEIPETSPFSPYARLFEVLFKSQNWSEFPNQIALEACAERVQTLCGTLAPEGNFQKTLNIYNLILEEWIFLTLFIQPTAGVEEAILRTLPEGVNPSTLMCYNSGMTCYDYILQALHSEYSEGEKPNLCILQGSYYELEGEFWYHQSQDWQHSTLDLTQGFEEPPDVFFLDLYPNNVTTKEAQRVDVADLVHRAIKMRDVKQPPITVVLDTSTTLLTDPAVWEVKEKLKGKIQKGTLRLIFVTSLAKFYSCGFDKYTGGAVVCFEPKGSMGQVPLRLKNFRDCDPMSREAKSFFSLLLEYASEEIGLFYATTLKNTESLYNALLENVKGRLEIQPKDFCVPVIGVQDPILEDKEQKEMIKELEERLFREAQASNLPLFIRASFPFAHSALVECDTALRIVAGFDAGENAEKYRSLLEKLSSN